MAAEVSSLARMPGRYEEEGEGEREPVTKDLLGGCGGGGGGGAAEVDLEIQVTTGWGRRLALSSGKAYLRQHELNPAPRHLQDLNLSPPSPSTASLGLNLSAAAATSLAPAEYQSVCTLEKVKSALERESRLAANARPLPPSLDASPSPPSSSSSAAVTSTSSSTKQAATERDEDGATAGGRTSTKRRAAAETDEDDGAEGAAGRTMAVATCPVCLLYVLIARVDPRCPRCAGHVPVNDHKKKPRIDLNFSLQSGNDDS